MQILYLWVKKYQNLSNLSLNFGGEFLFNITENNLTIERNPYYIKDFFSVNNNLDTEVTVKTVTGIVGENGTGKSTILKLIPKIITELPISVIEFFIVYKTDKGHFYDLRLDNDLHYNSKKINNQISFSFHNQVFNRSNISSTKYNIAFFSNVYDLTAHPQTLNLNSHIFDLSTNSLYKNKNFFTNEIYNQILFIKKVENDFGINAMINIPQKIKLNITTPKQIEEHYEQLHQKLKNNITEKIIPNLVSKEIKDNYNPFLANIFKSIYTYFYFYISNRIHERYYLPYQSLNNTFLKTIEQNSFDSFEEFFNSFLIELEITYKNDHFKNETNIEFVNNNTNVVIQSSKNKYIAIKELIKLLPALNIGHEMLLSIDNPYILEFLSLYERCNFKISIFELFWSELSSGEYAFLTLFSRFNTITHKVSDNLLILIDEGDLYFHPQWQKDWLFTFINIISYLFQKTSIQIILTTHSPFILSDLPSGNVILLKKDDNKKIRTVKNLEGNQLTFAANIHDLLTNSYFMHDGLVGKFAQHKINTLVDEILDSSPEKVKSNSSRIRKQIDIIGEPIVKRKLIEIFEDKIKLDVLSINEKIERLQQQIDELRTLKDDKN
ncbi:AAA family ATPase [Bacillus wiedmannii]|uniref:AAA family ATPase n=1 Tax=Bacillus cereus group TaxID=86661 RepID=UPI000BF35050|nr:AAA family ATPase [Bacillus cereus]PFL77102.1 hypothetical protein COJ31_25855 [Bacillus cereus]